MAAVRVVVEGGMVRMIHRDDIVQELKPYGVVKTKRASYVEPFSNGQWTADMGPVGGPVLGPFETREIALSEEVRWLHERGF